MSDIGKERRLRHIFNNSSELALLVHPNNGAHSQGTLVAQTVGAGATGIVASVHFAATHENALVDTAIALRVGTSAMRETGNTPDTFTHISLAAVKANMSAIIAPYDISSVHEPLMLQSVGNLASACDALGVPVIVDVQTGEETGPKAIRHAARAAIELGAAAVVLPYTGSRDSFATCVGITMDTPVLVKNRPNATVAQNLELAAGAVQAGAAGVCFDSQAFAGTHPAVLTRAINWAMLRG